MTNTPKQRNARRRVPSPSGPARVIPDRLLPLRDVIDFSGLSKTTIYALIRQNEFPHPYKPGGHASRWSERELLEWRSLLAGRRGAIPQPPGQ